MRGPVTALSKVLKMEARMQRLHGVGVGVGEGPLTELWRGGAEGIVQCLESMGWEP